MRYSGSTLILGAAMVQSVSNNRPSVSRGLSNANKANETTKTNDAQVKEAQKTQETQKAQAPDAVETVRATQETQDATRTRVQGEEAAAKAGAFRAPPSTGVTASRGLAGANEPAALSATRRGQRGQNVENLQRQLNAAGAGLATDGIFGPKTEAAVKAFQTRAGLNPDGIVGPKTLAALEAHKRMGNAGNLRWGAEGPQVQAAQEQLNKLGYNLDADGKYGNATYAAVRDFQSRAGLPIDGSIGAHTQHAMDDVAAGHRRLSEQGTPTAAATGPSPESHTDVPNQVAQFDRLTKVGQRNQMAHGRITVNGNTYDFRSGGGGRGHLPPGDYNVTRHLDRRSDKNSMMVGGEGYSFALSDKYDSRVGDTRSLLRIHPDGGGPGTIGCIGIVGDASVQRQFRADMLAELERNGGSYTLQVRE